MAVIYFETDDKTDAKNVVEMAANRMEEVFSVQVLDTHYEDVTNNEPTNSSDTKEV